MEEGRRAREVKRGETLFDTKAMLEVINPFL
jgi:hypothetical protein